MPAATQSSFHFQSYKLVHCSFTENAHPLAEDLRYNVGLETKSSEAGPTDEGHRATVVTLKIWLQWQPEPGPFALEMVAEGVFTSDADMPIEQYRDLCEIHGPALIYTQFRPIARLLISESGQEFMLPLINIGDTVRKMRANQREAAPLLSTP
jgi:preprotein translocase subunit SecB